MSQLNIRHGIVNEVYNGLSGLIYSPPNSKTRSVSVPPEADLDEVKKRLEEIRPYWQVYLESVEKGYAYQNMQEDERTKYIACIWWMRLLEGYAFAEAK